MLSYIVGGLVTGGIYAISAMALVITYNASKVFNFGQAAIAFFVAYCYHFLHTEVGLPVFVAAVLCLFVIAPGLGLLLWAVLLNRLGSSVPLVRLAGTIGLQVALTAATALIFGHQPVYEAAGLIKNPEVVLNIAGVALSSEQLLILGAAVLVAAVGAVVLYGTTAGLITRGAVDSKLMTVLTGTNPNAVTAVTWAAGAALAGLAGILIAPRVGLDSLSFANLIAASFAGVVIGKLTNLWRAFAGALLVGVAQSVVVPYLPDSGLLATALRPSIPFLFMMIAILVYSRSSELRAETQQREVASLQSDIDRRQAHNAALMRGKEGRWDRRVGWILLAGVIVFFPIVLDDFWIGVVALGLAYSVIFLSYRLITGEVGVIGLSQITFAGLGAIATGQLATVYGLPVLPAILLSAVIAGLCGIVVGVVCLPLGQLYTAITTFAFALLIGEVVFPMQQFSNMDSGIAVDRPAIGSFVFDGNVSFYFLMVASFAAVGLLLWNLRRSTTGMVFATIRASRARAETLGFNIFGARLWAFILGAGVAGLGGGFVASYQLVALPNAYLATAGLVWFAVAIAQGANSMGGAAMAGLSLAVMPPLFGLFLPSELGDLPALLFGLMAILLVAQPSGINVQLRAQMRGLAVAVERAVASRSQRPVERPEAESVGDGQARQEPVEERA
ncbi:ABC transporter permease [Streptosporangium sp. NPDC002607]